MKVIIIDNYDSFTYNLAHLVKELGADVTVWYNDCFKLSQIAAFDKILLSPGPGLPSEAGLLLDVIRVYADSKSILGVCLGHQAIAEVYGGVLLNLPNVYHGIASMGTQLGNDPIFTGLPEQITMGRYHSNDGQIMGLKHKHYDLHGIQFHPESILTPQGRVIIRNWLEI